LYWRPRKKKVFGGGVFERDAADGFVLSEDGFKLLRDRFKGADKFARRGWKKAFGCAPSNNASSASTVTCEVNRLGEATPIPARRAGKCASASRADGAAIRRCKWRAPCGRAASIRQPASGVGVSPRKVTVLALLALLMGASECFLSSHGVQLIRALEAIPKQLESILAQNENHPPHRAQIRRRRRLLFPRAPIQFPAALEGALKLKEISYIHAEGYPAAEMKARPDRD